MLLILFKGLPAPTPIKLFNYSERYRICLCELEGLFETMYQFYLFIKRVIIKLNDKYLFIDMIKSIVTSI